MDHTRTLRTAGRTIVPACLGVLPQWVTHDDDRGTPAGAAEAGAIPGDMSPAGMTNAATAVPAIPSVAFLPSPQ
jgi:hypothetical protein